MAERTVTVDPHEAARVRPDLMVRTETLLVMLDSTTVKQDDAFMPTWPQSFLTRVSIVEPKS